MRKLVLWAVLVVVLAVSNWSIVGKERVLANGETMLLALAPRDPRSLLQGDYMTLRYSIADEIERELGQPAGSYSTDGRAIVRLDRNGVAALVRIGGNAEDPGAGDRLLRFRKRGASLRIAGDAFFFEEGGQDLYADARYGELRVAAAGDAVLVGLRDAEFRSLGPPATE